MEALLNCISCNSENLVGEVTVKRLLPLAKRNGTVKVGGQAITQIDLKNAWSIDSEGNEKPIRGPVFCMDCAELMMYDASEGGLRAPKVGEV
jgi:hypothetical protein